MLRFDVAMSSSATPAAFRASISAVALLFACCSAALAVGRCTLTPSCTVAMSGFTVAIPCPVTVIVRETPVVGGVVLGGDVVLLGSATAAARGVSHAQLSDEP